MRPSGLAGLLPGGWPCAGFAIAAAVLSALVFGVVPSLYASRVPMLGTRGSSATLGSRLVRETLVAVQVMLTIILLTASISVGRAFAHLMHIDRGFDCRGLDTVNVSLQGTTHQTAASRFVYFQEALGGVRRLRGVQSASATEFLPLYATSSIGGRFRMNGRGSGVCGLFPNDGWTYSVRTRIYRPGSTRQRQSRPRQ